MRHTYTTIIVNTQISLSNLHCAALFQIVRNCVEATVSIAGIPFYHFIQNP